MKHTNEMLKAQIEDQIKKNCEHISNGLHQSFWTIENAKELAKKFLKRDLSNVSWSEFEKDDFLELDGRKIRGLTCKNIELTKSAFLLAKAYQRI